MSSKQTAAWQNFDASSALRLYQPLQQREVWRQEKLQQLAALLLLRTRQSCRSARNQAERQLRRDGSLPGA